MTDQSQHLDESGKLGILILVGGNASPLPLEQTAVVGQIVGPVASVSVTQTFRNPFPDRVSLAYLFPLPHEAAVTDLTIQIGARTVRAELKALEAARTAFNDAVESGKRAGLLEQRRPNLFSIQIGNVLPGEPIIATIRYQERLRYSDDRYEFVFPMGVTPKYHADPSQSAQVDSPVAAPGEKIGGVSLTLSVDTGVPVADPVSPSHPIQVTRQDERRLTITLPDGVIPNKDFVVRLPVASQTVQTAVWLSADADADTALISVLPPRLDTDLTPDPREFIFVIDRSGSMSGEPITQAKNALRACLRALGTTDTFLLQAFDDQVEWFNAAAQPITQQTVSAADNWLNTIDARGGTKILESITAALAIPTDPTRQRYVVFLTDGAVSAGDEALAQIKKQRGTARIFTFGIGPSVNRAILAKMAEFGRGTAQFLQIHEDIEQAVTKFQDRVSYPALHDLKLDWHGVQAWDTYPAALPDLYVGQPLELVTRFKREAESEAASVTISGTRRGQVETYQALLPAANTTDATIRRVWARARVEALIDTVAQDHTARQQVIGLAIEHHLLTAFTAFVAVDSEVVAPGGDAPSVVNVSIPLPEGLTFGHTMNMLGSAPQAMPSAASGGGGVGMRMLRAAPNPLRALTSRLQSYGAPSQPLSPPPSPPSAPAPNVGAPPPPSPSAPAPLGRRISEDLPDWLSASAPPPEMMYSLREPMSDAERPEPEAMPPLSIEGRIKWLARTQQINGSWDNDMELTAVALLAFVRAGHTTRTGSYRQQIKKAVGWLQTNPGRNNLAMFIRWSALGALWTMEGVDVDTMANTFVKAFSLEEAKTDVERAALGDPASKAPAALSTLDDLRIAALVDGAVDNDALKGAKLSPAERRIAQFWLAIGSKR